MPKTYSFIRCEEPENPEAWVCRCGTTVGHGDGFNNCNRDGTIVDLDKEEKWDGHQMCATCGLIIENPTGRIVGQGQGFEKAGTVSKYFRRLRTTPLAAEKAQQKLGRAGDK